MTNKELFHRIIEKKSDRCGLWHGCPNPRSTENIFRYFGVSNDYELGLKCNDTFRWLPADHFNTWKGNGGYPFNSVEHHESKNIKAKSPFAELTDDDISKVEAMPWPEAKDCDFTEVLAEIDKTVKDGTAVLSGMWSCFYHNVADMFGMENYFMKMYTDPAVVEAVTERVVNFYIEANDRLFRQAGNRIDAFFFGNDFGSQLDMLISPEMFQKFVMPYFKKLTTQAKSFGYKVVLHSCGAIDKAIPSIIDAGVDAIHPIQAKARSMDAVSLQRRYGGQIVFIGGVDTQELLPFGTKQQVKDEVKRLKELFGPNFIVSPSHESILPEVPPENLEALVEATFEA